MKSPSPGKLLGWSLIVAVNLCMIILMGVVFLRFAPAETFSVSLGEDLLDVPALDTEASFVLQRYKPNLRKVRYTPSSPVAHGAVEYGGIELSTNSWGFRDVDHKLKKVKRTIRIAISGDSFAFGPNLDQENTLGVVLQKFLDEDTRKGKGATYEVMNFGISGLNFEGMTRVTEQYALPFRPDIVLYTHICDDLSATDVTTWAAWARDWTHVLEPLPTFVQDLILNRVMVGYKELRYRFDDIRYGEQPELAGQRVEQVLGFIEKLQDRVPHRVLFLNFCGNRILSRRAEARQKKGALMAVLDVTKTELDHTQHPTPRGNASNSTRIMSTLKMLKWPAKILEDQPFEPIESTLDVLDVDCGYYHCCAVDAGHALRCWGAGTREDFAYPHYGQARPPRGEFTRVFSGGYHSCGLTRKGRVVCWGRGMTDSAPSDLSAVQDLSAGFMHTCAVTGASRIRCWGDNAWGQSSPPDGSFVRVVAGGDTTCGLRSDGGWQCWGASVPGQDTSEVQSIALQDSGGCMVGSGGHPRCWTRNGEIASAGTWQLTKVFAATDHACGLTKAGQVHCWGNRISEKTISVSTPLRRLSLGRGFNCGQSMEGKLLCWGDSDLEFGELDLPSPRVE